MDSPFDDYLVSDFGRIKNGKTLHIIKPHLVSGYPAIKIAKKRFKIHRLVAKKFVEGETKERFCVNHKDLNKTNNHYSNLEWTTPKENTLHAVRMGALDKRRKLTEVVKKKCISMHINGFTNDEISKSIGISHVEVWRFLVKNGVFDKSNIYNKPILDLNTGVYYKNAEELSYFLGIESGCLHRKLTGEIPNDTSYIYV